MIETTSGDLLKAPVEALVNAINTVGVMGKGIALQFRQAYPQMFRDYARACRSGKVQLGKMHIHDLGSGLAVGPRWIINFPTKAHWREQSRLADIEAGLKDLVGVIERLQIRSVAVPALGCGLGGLNWTDVHALIDAALGKLPDVKVLVFAAAAPPTTMAAPFISCRNSGPFSI